MLWHIIPQHECQHCVMKCAIICYDSLNLRVWGKMKMIIVHTLCSNKLESHLLRPWSLSLLPWRCWSLPASDRFTATSSLSLPRHWTSHAGTVPYCAGEHAELAIISKLNSATHPPFLPIPPSSQCYPPISIKLNALRCCLCCISPSAVSKHLT